MTAIGNQIPEQQTTVINEKLSQISGQNDILQSVWKDAYSAIERMRNLGMRLNSNGHPDNLPQVEKNSVQGAECKPRLDIPDGVVGRIESVIQSKAQLLDEWNDKIWPAIIRQLNYLEQHI